MIVHVEEILGIYARLGQINSMPIEKITFYKDGKKIEIPSEIIEEFKFTGLNNVDFIRMDFQEEMERQNQSSDTIDKNNSLA